MDGIEHSRMKYNWVVKKFLKYAEYLAVKHSAKLIADSVVIKEYLKDKYGSGPVFIPYGANVFKDPEPSYLKQYGVEPGKFFIVVARLQPDNNIESVINGVLNSTSRYPLLIIGNYKSAYGSYLNKKYSSDIIKFAGSEYDITTLNNLRYYSNLYFHGHSAGGTNPSLLEAMASSALICANDNPFNRAILGKNAFYFNSEEDISKLVNSKPRKRLFEQFIQNNLLLIKEKYDKKQIINDYYNVFCDELGIKRIS
jgi:glycosyltransferase involved in cell wall biosynthesis